MFKKIKKSLFNFIVKNFKDEIDGLLQSSIKIDIKDLALHMDYDELAKNIDPKLLAINLDYEELVEKVSLHIYEEMIIDYDKIVSRIDTSDIAEYFDLDDIAKNIDISEHIDFEEIVEKIDYKEIVKEMMATLKSRGY